ncbi:hypothetical protein [Lacticaseibacillus porcinae]|uniref:hypothetical protein n=1 Tax=Lacticaseibacillus porcinae TaxID=1123687 RepID=UPI000F7776EE|nr:hypothetical protein [Lacticaseibacillus porcinae]
MKFKKTWLIGFVVLLSMVTGSRIEHVDADIAGSIVPPVSTVPTTAYSSLMAPINFIPQGSLGTSSGQYSSALNWQSPDSTQASARYAVLFQGQSVNVYTRYYYGGAGQVKYKNMLRVTGNPTSKSGESIDLSSTNQTNVTALTNSDPVLKNASVPSKSANIGYRLTAPKVSAPTWVYFQSMFTSNDSNASYAGSTIFAMLVLPTNYKYTTSLDQKVIFPGSFMNATPTTIDGVTPSFATSTTSGAGTWGIVGGVNRFTPTALGTTTATFVFPVSVPWPASSGTQVNIDDPSIAYIGQLDDQTVSLSSDAKFELQLPSGLTAGSSTWLLNEYTFLGSGTDSITVSPSKQKLADDTDYPIRALVTVNQNGVSIASGVPATAKLHVVSASLAVDVSSPIIYTGDDVPTGSNQSQASATWGGQSTSDVKWSVDNTSLATIDATSGKLTANTTGDTGTVKVTGTYLNGTTTESKTTNVIVARQPDTKAVTTGSSYTLSAPAVSGSTYQWQRYDAATKQWQNISGATDQDYKATAATADDQAQFRVVLTNNGNTTISNPTTLFVNPAGLALLSVPDYYFYTLNSTGSMNAPTVDDLIMGKYAGSANINWNDLTTAANNWLVSKSPDPNLDPDPIVVSDASATSFNLSVSMSPFRTTDDSAYLTNADGGSAAIAFGLKDGTNWTQSEVFDDNQSATVLTSGKTDPSTGRATLDYQALLAFNRIPVVRAGRYGSSLTWTLANTPQ